MDFLFIFIFGLFLNSIYKVLFFVIFVLEKLKYKICKAHKVSWFTLLIDFLHYCSNVNSRRQMELQLMDECGSLFFRFSSMYFTLNSINQCYRMKWNFSQKLGVMIAKGRPTLFQNSDKELPISYIVQNFIRYMCNSHRVLMTFFRCLTNMNLILFSVTLQSLHYCVVCDWVGLGWKQEEVCK